MGQPPVGLGLHSRFGQGHERHRPEAKIAALALDHEALHPALGARGLHEEVKPVPISVAASLGGIPHEDGAKRLLGVGTGLGATGDIGRDLIGHGW
jgi:hypothetical protein